MLVYFKNDEGRVLGIPAISQEDASKGVVSYSKNNLVTLIPGWNEVPEDLWPKCVAHIQSKLDSDEITLYGKKDENGEVIQCGLHEARADKAREIVRGTLNLTNLKDWANDTKLSSELRALVDIQLTACEKGEDPNKKK